MKPSPPVLILVFLCGMCNPSVRAEEQLSSFVYSYYGGGKTRLSGEIGKDKFHVRLASSYPTDYDLRGTTSERSWALIAWLFEYGTKPDVDPHGSFEATFTKSNGETVKKSFDVGREHITFFQILHDCEYPNAEDRKYPDRKSELVKFEYSCESNTKHGEVSIEKFRITQKSNAPEGFDAKREDYDKEGKTEKRTWELIQWLFKYGVAPEKDADVREFYVVSFHTANGQVIKASLSPRNNIILHQIIKDLGDPRY